MVSVRCTRKERQHWERWLEKHTHEPLTLSQGMRLWANNTTGVNDPPELEAFADRHIHEWIARLSGILRERKRRASGTELGLAATVAICQCCLRGHHLFHSFHPHFLS